MKYFISTILFSLLFINKAESIELSFPAYIQDKNVSIDTYSIENDQLNILGINGSILKCPADKTIEGFIDITYLTIYNKPYSFSIEMNEFVDTLEVYQTFEDYIDLNGYLYVEDKTSCK
jgi:hypothetical protein